MGWPSSWEHQGTVPVNRHVTQYNHKSESLVLSAGWPAHGIPNSASDNILLLISMIISISAKMIFALI